MTFPSTLFLKSRVINKKVCWLRRNHNYHCHTIYSETFCSRTKVEESFSFKSNRLPYGVSFLSILIDGSWVIVTMAGYVVVIVDSPEQSVPAQPKLQKHLLRFEQTLVEKLGFVSNLTCKAHQEACQLNILPHFPNILHCCDLLGTLKYQCTGKDWRTSGWRKLDFRRKVFHLVRGHVQGTRLIPR